jgi:hypothetical protein
MILSDTLLPLYQFYVICFHTIYFLGRDSISKQTELDYCYHNISSLDRDSISKHRFTTVSMWMHVVMVYIHVIMLLTISSIYDIVLSSLSYVIGRRTVETCISVWASRTKRKKRNKRKKF